MWHTAMNTVLFN